MPAMRALFNRFNRHKPDSPQKRKDSEKEPIALPPLACTALSPSDVHLTRCSLKPQWPPQPPSHASPSPQVKPLPDLAERPLPPIAMDALTELASPQPSFPEPSPSLDITPIPRVSSAPSQSDSAGRHSGRTGTSSATIAQLGVETTKKVAFISPSPTPIDMRMPPQVKTNVSRFVTSQETARSTSTASGSKTNLRNASRASGKSASAPSAPPLYASSVRSSTPYSQSVNSSRILATASWSEAAEEDLVSNLGPRERTRQEVLWEIVASEERYVNELVKMKETFIDPLLHPFSTSPVSSPTLPETIEEAYYHPDSPRESMEYLPIASRFLSPSALSAVPGLSAPQTPISRLDREYSDEEDDRDTLTNGLRSPNSAVEHEIPHPRSPYRNVPNGRASRVGDAMSASVPFPSRSHHSLPPPARNYPAASTTSLGRPEGTPPQVDDRRSTATPASRMLRRLKKSNPNPVDTQVVVQGAVAPHKIPEDLRRCLSVIEGGILKGHLTLSEGLQKRYEEQYPLVRSLADVFVAQSQILREYATYVLHLERALEQVHEALSNAPDSKRSKKGDDAEAQKISKYLRQLEATAADKGETGLSISLSKPFQRLLKYPLLFQNLLFHTDPSTYEYESTLQMVAEVETIVRSIEDEKIQKDEGDRTRDAYARIEGIDKDVVLAVPKPTRVLMEERPLNPDNTESPGRPSSSSGPQPSTSSSTGAVKGKSSFKRLSDVLQPNGGSKQIGGKKDLWLVVFNDVVLRCQRTGITTLPLVTTLNSRTNSMPELQGKAKYATTGRRNTHSKPRNMYKLIKIETWDIGSVQKPTNGLVSMEEIRRSRAQMTTPTLAPNEEEEPAEESDDSDRKSKMSFSYWGADKVTIQKPSGAKSLAPVTTVRGKRSPKVTTPYGRESSADAKFGTRLVSTNDSVSGAAGSPRPNSRRTAYTPQPRRHAASEESAITKATTTVRPAWDGSTRTAPIVSPVPRRNNSNTDKSVGRAKVASPAPSEDSGVGMYRQMLAQDPSLNQESP
ncbi:Dbl homology domain-containing protein [Sistotremastrum niveocremeum HHB9708]|uniref:Dbl homology domain-containing protein n=1 Tax=Sistotremastrum niveocremeum HHB9708 TaxID=1314777 RepID=A0A165AIG7_9AGAM|nr:Dbl homology domain-containing protein [Sistotremastrum niveocremeum HHB9708]